MLHNLPRPFSHIRLGAHSLVFPRERLGPCSRPEDATDHSLSFTWKGRTLVHAPDHSLTSCPCTGVVLSFLIIFPTTPSHCLPTPSHYLLAPDHSLISCPCTGVVLSFLIIYFTPPTRPLPPIVFSHQTTPSHCLLTPYHSLPLSPHTRPLPPIVFSHHTTLAFSSTIPLLHIMPMYLTTYTSVILTISPLHSSARVQSKRKL